MNLQHQNEPRALLERAPVPALTTVNGVVMSVVYYTAPPTFTGVIGSYTTLAQDGDDDSSTSVTRLRNSAQSSPQRTASSGLGPSTLQSSPLASTTPNNIAATGLYPTASDPGLNTNTGAFGASATDGSSSSTSNNGMSVGAKIGLGAGIICGIGAIAIILLIFLARKRKQKEHDIAESEKKEMANRPPTSDPAGQFKPNAPRLSLRPVSRLIPDLMGGAQQKNRLSQGNMLASVSENNNKAYNMAPISPAAQTSNSAMNRPKTADNPFNDPENPFADPEKGLRSPGATNRMPVSPVGHSVAAGGPVSPIEPLKDQRISGPTAESFPIPQGQAQTPYPAPSATSSALPLAMPTANVRHELPAGAPAPIVAPGPGPEAPQGNVYRILMDFRPTMEDELELRAGQLVRLLHEYDDGWALCIRLDRSQQGVVPRTCLAAKPSKPRPGPGPGPNSRPITPQGRPRGPPGPFGPPRQGPPGQGIVNPHMTSGPGSIRAHSPAAVSPDTGAFNQTPRPLSPGPRPMPQKRSTSPGTEGSSKPSSPVTEQPTQQNQAAGTSNVQNHMAPPPGPGAVGPAPHPARSESPGVAM